MEEVLPGALRRWVQKIRIVLPARGRESLLNMRLKTKETVGLKCLNL